MDTLPYAVRCWRREICSLPGRRGKNEDVVRMEHVPFGGKGAFLFLACDGMGGLPHGKEAAATCTDMAFQAAKKEFDARNVELIGCSTDTEFCHLAWSQTPRSKGGIEGVEYPLVADTNKTIARDYGVLAGASKTCPDGKVCVEGEMVAYRGLFLIDKNGIVQHEVVNNFPLGRSTEEEIRMVDALQHFETYGEVCPMNWHKGEDAMKPTSEGVAEYLKESYK